MRFALLTTFAACLASCGDEPNRVGAATTALDPTLQAVTLPTLTRDFGLIPHGEARTSDFILDASMLPCECVPLRVQLDCSCGHGELLYQGQDGHERPIDGRPDTINAAQPGETLIARIRIETVTKDPVDLPVTQTRGYVLLQPTTDLTGQNRLQWPFQLRFGIDAPIECRPFAALDFGKVPRSSEAVLETRLRGDRAHPNVRFGPVSTTLPQLQAELVPEINETVLRVRCHPGEPGSYRGIVRVATDLPSRYAVNLAATWKVVDDLEASPMAKVSFRAELERAQTEDESADQFVLVTDHDASRPAEFVIRELVDQDGVDATAAFAVTFSPVPGRDRVHRMTVRYLGGRTTGFRGRIVLAKTATGIGPTLPIELVVFPATR